MLVTLDHDDELRSRPMAVAAVEDPDVIWFATRTDTGKVDEIRKDSRVAVTFQGTTRFVSVPGRAEVVIDAERIEALWNDSWKLWFPEGKEGDIALVRVEADRAEMWKTSGLDAVNFALEAGRALLEGDEVRKEPGEHRTVSL